MQSPNRYVATAALCLSAVAVWAGISVKLSSSAVAAPLPYSTPVTAYVTTQNMLDGGFPTSATDGINLFGLAYIRPTACAVDGGNLSGTGKLYAEERSVATGTWAHVPDWDKTFANTGERCQSWNELEVGTHSGQFKYIFSGAGATWPDAGTVTTGTVTLESVNY